MSSNSHSLYHVKSSRTLDIHGQISSSTSSEHSSNSKLSQNRQQKSGAFYSKDLNHSHSDNHAHSHSNGHHRRTSSNSTNHSIHKKSSMTNSSPTINLQTVADNAGTTSRHASTNLSGTPSFAQKKQNHHLLNVLYQHEGVPEPGRGRPWPYFSYMLNGFKNLFLTFYFNWSLLFTAPISSIIFIIVYPTTLTFLALFEMGLKLFMETCRGDEVVRYISLKYGQGFGAINWGAPELLLSDSSTKLVKNTLSTLGASALPIHVSGSRRRTFDLSIAQTFVLLSSLIYERDAKKVKEAYKLYKSSRKVATEKLSPEINASAENIIESRIKELIWESESRIRQIAESWGLHFAGVSELKSLGGHFCGIFWSETIPFIVVAFKGTTPTNYEEFLVDATFQRTDARSFLFGCVHEGFYESLFSTTGFGDQDIRDPYGAILAAVQDKAAQIQERLNTTEPVQLWITGHSLGAALSSLLFARWLKCPSDLSRRLILRDAYIIGTPAVGDSDFASVFSSHTNLPVTRSSTLWRIINKSDVFCRLPPGYDSKTCGHFMSESDFFNYSHIGHAIQITQQWHSKPLKSYPSSYQPPTQVDIVVRTDNKQPHQANHQFNKIILRTDEDEQTLPNWAKLFMDKKPHFLQRYLPNGNPIYFIEKLYPFFLKDHIPSQYFQGLQRARVYYENEEAKLINRQNQTITETLALKQ